MSDTPKQTYLRDNVPPELHEALGAFSDAAFECGDWRSSDNDGSYEDASDRHARARAHLIDTIDQMITERVDAALAQLASGAEDRATLRREVESLPKWGLVSRGGEPPELDHTKHGTFIERGAVLRLLACARSV